jgi:hypothetical protein
VTFEVDDQNRTFNYTLQHRGDSIYQDELADLFHRLGDTICRETPGHGQSSKTNQTKPAKQTPGEKQLEEEDYWQGENENPNGKRGVRK